MELPATKQEKIKLAEINQYLTCYLCKGYLIDATTISECLHSFCRSCIIKFLQDNSYCPVCELIINKAKPNLKLDKTLQDIVYKLVPELFLKEMLRRKTFYRDYPQIATRVSPEERGEDTERTIFNPQEMISLSLEYICDDSTPGAIRIPGIATDPEILKNNGGTAEESQESQMKRYLLCPGMCRIEVLKKFVRNKYNVDTSQFFIDLLYKRVPLPDHYTLIDIAYIYSWQRNELMKFFFRIIDRNKAKRTESPENNTPKYLPRHARRNKSNAEKTSVSKRKESSLDKKSHRKPLGKINNGASQEKAKKEVKVCDSKRTNINTSVKSGNDANSDREGGRGDSVSLSDKTKMDHLEKRLSKKAKSEPCKELSNIEETNLNETDKGLKYERCKNATDKENESNNYTSDEADRTETLKVKLNETDNEIAAAVVSDNNLGKENVKEVEVPKHQIGDSHKDRAVVTKMEKKVCEPIDNSIKLAPCEIKDDSVKTEQIKTEIKNERAATPIIKKEPKSPSDKTEGRLILKVSKDLLGEPDLITSNAHNFTMPITKSYTSITLNRSENVEIITKIEPVSNKDGQPIGHHIIKQTIKKGQKVKNTPKKGPGKPGHVPRIVISKKTVKKKASPKRAVKAVESEHQLTDIANETVPLNEVLTNENQSSDNRSPVNAGADAEDEKSKFLKCVELTPTSSLPFKNETSPPLVQQAQLPKKQLIISKVTGGQKRKSTSPIKNSKAKWPKVETKKPIKIILHEKPNPSKTSTPLSATQSDIKRDNGLQSLINNCKIPSSLSITIMESSEIDSPPLMAPPVKNFIEILKLPDETSSSSDQDKNQSSDNKPKELTQLEISKFCDNDSEQKVDQDLSEIAKSLTEKIPMSTTVSQIVGPKQQFQIPIKTNIPQQFQIQPAPVPELNVAGNIVVPPQDNLVKLNPRSPQTFQKIFEESLKKVPEGPKTSAVEVEANAISSSMKRNFLEIASQLLKKTKLEDDKTPAEVKEEVSLPKVAIPRLPNPRTSKSMLKKFEPDQINKLVPQTVASLHSSSLGMNYTVSVNQHSPSKTTKVNGIVSPVKAESVPKVPECKLSVSPLNELKSITTDFKVPSPSLGSPKLPEVSSVGSLSPRPKTPSPKHSPKSSPLVKHMYAPTVPIFSQKVLSPMNRFASLSSKPSKSSSTSPRLPSLSPKPVSISPRPPTPTATASTPEPSPSSSTPNGNSSNLSTNEILEKYNIQNLAQLTANFNFNPAVVTNNHLAAFQHAMLLKHFEMQNRHNWLNRNQGPLLQYEKYLQSLNGGLNGSPSNL